MLIIVGRRQEQEHERLLGLLGSRSTGTCRRCGAERPAEELAVKGFGPFTRLVCRDGCRRDK